MRHADIANACGYIELLLQYFPVMILARSAAQASGIEFVEALMAMPSDQAPDSFPNCFDLNGMTKIPL